RGQVQVRCPRSASSSYSGRGVECVGERADEPTDVGLLDDEWRRELDRIAAVPHVEALGEALHRDLVRALGGLARKRLERESRGEAVVADVDHVLASLETVNGGLPVRR